MLRYQKRLLVFTFLPLCLLIILKGGITVAECKGKKVLMVVAKNGFRDEECNEPRQILENAVVSITVASSSVGTCTGMLGMRVKAEVAISDVKPSDYDAVIFVGGAGSSEFWNNGTAHSIAKQMFQDDKLVTAICIAPVTLANAGLLQNKKATVWSSEVNSIKQKGAVYTGASVECDGNIITGSGPTTAHEFGTKLLAELCKK